MAGSGALALPGGRLSGTLPTQIGMLSGLRMSFNLNNNALTGTIPDLAPLTALQQLNQA